MGHIWHILALIGYALLAIAIAAAGPHLLIGVESLSSLLVGLVLFLLCAMLQEAYLRRVENQKALRRLLLLKRMLDRDRDETVLLRNELRRLFEAIEASGDRRVLAALDAAGLVRKKGRRSDALPSAPAVSSETNSDDYGTRALFQQMEQDAYRSDRPKAPGPSMPFLPSFLRRKDVDEAEQEAKSEVRILHNLVEQLYSGRKKPVTSPLEKSTDDPDSPQIPSTVALSTGAPPTNPVLTSAAKPDTDRGLRASLRVVGGAATAHSTSILAVEPSLPEPVEHTDSVSEAAMLATVREALQADRVDLYLQPIVSLPQRKRRFYECFSRIRSADGRVLSPDEYMPVAREANLQTVIDNMLLFRCVQLLRRVRRKELNTAFFCNIAPNSLGDREFFRDFIDYMESHLELVPNLILEFSQADIDREFDGVAGGLKRLGGLGYRFSLDNITNLDLDLSLLEQHHFAFLKVESGRILDHLKRGGADSAMVHALKQDSDGRDMDLIVDRIESEATLLELLDFNIDFGQGYLFGEPRQSKAPSSE